MKGNGQVKGQVPKAKALREMAAEAGNAGEADVKYNIYKALQEAAQMEAKNISVERIGGKVILSGTARTWAEREEVERAAWASPGVFEVKNHIKVAV